MNIIVKFKKHKFSMLLCVIVAASAACTSESHKKLLTRAKLDELIYEYRLYHKYHPEPAKSPREVVAEARRLVQAIQGTEKIDDRILKTSEEILLDGWGNNFTFAYTIDGDALTITITSPGKDGIIGTEDDISAVYQMNRADGAGH